jgi:hypothetical protein
MPCVGFEPAIPASEQAKTAHALDRSSTVTGLDVNIRDKILTTGDEQNLSLCQI